MKLLRFGPKGHEKPGVLDARGVVRDLSGVIADLTPEQLSPAGLAELRALDLTTLPEVATPGRLGTPFTGLGQFIGVGLNYRDHAAEANLPIPGEPILFAKWNQCFSGPNDPIVMPKGSRKTDWEVELGVVIGTPVRRASEAEAEAAIAGFTVMNDVSVRDWQFRTIEWTQGKIWDSSTPVGPYLVTPDEVGGVRPALTVRTTVDGRVMQEDDTATLLFDPVHLVQYVSTVIRLNPGDLIATGTPAGVGHARDPKVYLVGGETVVTEVEGIGACTNTVVKE